MYGERRRAQMREESRDIPRFSIFYCGCKQPKSIHMLLLRLQRYKLFPIRATFPCFSLCVLKKSLSLCRAYDAQNILFAPIRQGMRTRQEYIDILKNHANELRDNYGISHMKLFGSVAKNEHHQGSDVDLFVVMPPKAYSLCAAADYLESILGTNVDLIRKHSNMRPFLLNQINKYGIDIFGQA